MLGQLVRTIWNKLKPTHFTEEETPAEPEDPTPQAYEWTRKCDGAQHELVGETDYVLPFNQIGDTRTGTTYRLIIKDFRENPHTITPISEKQRTCMWYPECQGPLNIAQADTSLVIDRVVGWEGHLPLYIIWFNNGNYVDGCKHSIGYGDSRYRKVDLHTAGAFRKEIQKYCRLESYEQFRTLFVNSDLPEEARNSIRDIIE